MTHHILGDEDRDEFFTVMNSNGVPYKLRRNGTPTSPGLDDLLRNGFVQLLDFHQQFGIDIRSLFY